MSDFVNFFKLKINPFILTPNFQLFYGSRKHMEALKAIYSGIINDKGVFVLTGEVGTGKTITSRILIEKLKNYYNIAYIVNPFLSREGIVKQIANELEINNDSKSFEALITDIHMFLIDQLKKGKGALVFIDEAQHLPDDTLEMVRILSNLETKQKKLLQFILIGQQELLKKLSQKNLRQIAQRVAVKCELKPFNHIETHDYILHRLKIAGGLGKIELSKIALYEIHKLTKGYPRSINILMYHVLTLAAKRNINIINIDIVRDAFKATLPLHLKIFPFSFAKVLRGWL